MLRCANCNKKLTGRSQKKYCCSECKQQKEYTERVKTWLLTGQCNPGSHYRHYVRRYLLLYQHDRCDLCGRPNKWHGKELIFILDHIDGNSDRNMRENLRMICPNCDSQLPTYKNRNLGHGRSSLRKSKLNAAVAQSGRAGAL